MDESHDKPDRAVKLTNFSSRFHLSPTISNMIEREFHAPKRSDRFHKNNSGAGMIEYFSKYKLACNDALKSLHYFKRKEMLYDLDNDKEGSSGSYNVVVQADSSSEVIKVVEDGFKDEEEMRKEGKEGVAFKYREMNGKVGIVGNASSVSNVASSLVDGKLLKSLTFNEDFEVSEVESGMLIYSKIYSSVIKRYENLKRIQNKIEISEKLLAKVCQLGPAKKHEDANREAVLPLNKDEKTKDASALSKADRYDCLNRTQSELKTKADSIRLLSPAKNQEDASSEAFLPLNKDEEIKDAHALFHVDRYDCLNRIQYELKNGEKSLASLYLLRPAKKPEDASTDAFLPLNKDEVTKDAHALSNADRSKVLVTHENSNSQISGEELQHLRRGAWLYDELIGGRTGYDYKSVQRWTTQSKLGYYLHECDKIFVPVQKEMHWCLGVINMKDGKFQYVDCLGGSDRQVTEVLAKYIVDEVKDKSGKDVDVTSWKQEFVKELPNQEKGLDCGMFMIKYIDFYSRAIGLKQELVPCSGKGKGLGR